MSTIGSRLSPLQKALALGGVIVLLALAVLAFRTGSAGAPVLDDKTLTEKAIFAAQDAGLQGSPTAQQAARMTLAEWLALDGAKLGDDAWQFGRTPDMPVFVLAMRGNVEWRTVGEIPPGQTGPEHYDNITIALNAQTGALISVVAQRPGFPLPLPVP